MSPDAVTCLADHIRVIYIYALRRLVDPLRVIGEDGAIIYMDAVPAASVVCNSPAIAIAFILRYGYSQQNSAEVAIDINASAISNRVVPIDDIVFYCWRKGSPWRCIRLQMNTSPYLCAVVVEDTAIGDSRATIFNKDCASRVIAHSILIDIAIGYRSLRSPGIDCSARG